MTATDSSAGNSYDVLVVGGGPAGSTISTLLTQHGLRVALFEREHFPRFHVGESLLPANLPIFDHLGCHDAVRQAGFIVKPGASFYDEYEGRATSTFTFQHDPVSTSLCLQRRSGAFRRPVVAARRERRGPGVSAAHGEAAPH